MEGGGVVYHCVHTRAFCTVQLANLLTAVSKSIAVYILTSFSISFSLEVSTSLMEWTGVSQTFTMLTSQPPLVRMSWLAR